LTSTRQIFGWRNAKLAARKKAIEKRTKGNEDMTRKNSLKKRSERPTVIPAYYWKMEFLTLF
jgi:hypothetical protein